MQRDRMEPYQDKILSDSGWKTRRVGRACTESRRDVIFNYESTAEERRHFAQYVLMASVGQYKTARHDGDVVSFCVTCDTGD